MPTRACDPTLFLPFVSQHSIDFDERDPRPARQQFPAIALPQALTKAVHKRQLEFLAGRYCAREALLRCAPELADVEIASGEFRQPLWPVGIVGSITHTAEYASVAVARTADARALGLDAELWMAPELATAIEAQIASRDEVDALTRATGLDLPRALTVIFSAKEALFKCLFSEVNRYFDFRDAHVGAVEASSGVLTARLLVTLTPTLHENRTFSLRFEHDQRFVFTGISLPV